jgi:hypothetical protein
MRAPRIKASSGKPNPALLVLVLVLVLDLAAGERPEDEGELFNRFIKGVIKAIWSYGV